ncbi:hypothetical protein GUI43_00074 [Micromonospora noduli]|nr:hypothetical protein GUI43_00074 [Micromonospora noduli]RAO34590.1 hypothetical protein ONO86_04702 [Micromonospora noduli]
MRATDWRSVAGSLIVLWLLTTDRSNDDSRKGQSVITGQA